MLSPAARRLRRMVAMHQELQAIRVRLIDLAGALHQDIADAKADVEREERAEHAQRSAARMGLPRA